MVLPYGAGRGPRIRWSGQRRSGLAAAVAKGLTRGLAGKLEAETGCAGKPAALTVLGMGLGLAWVAPRATRE